MSTWSLLACTIKCSISKTEKIISGVMCILCEETYLIIENFTFLREDNINHYNAAHNPANQEKNRDQKVWKCSRCWKK